MQKRPIIVTHEDLHRLRELIQTYRSQHNGDSEPADLEAELDRAKIAASDRIPPDVVTMNATALVRVDGSRRAQAWTVVYPPDADLDAGRISVLSPLGTALLGYRAGDTFEWDMPAGRRQYYIVKVLHQPEAAGEPSPS